MKIMSFLKFWQIYHIWLVSHFTLLSAFSGKSLIQCQQCRKFDSYRLWQFSISFFCHQLLNPTWTLIFWWRKTSFWFFKHSLSFIFSKRKLKLSRNWHGWQGLFEIGWKNWKWRESSGNVVTACRKWKNQNKVTKIISNNLENNVKDLKSPISFHNFRNHLEKRQI